MTRHLSELSLLSYRAGKSDERELQAATDHLEGCPICRRALEEMGALDRELRSLAGTGDLARDLELDDLPPGDPFRRQRWPGPRKHSRRGMDPLLASEAALEKADQLLETAMNSPSPADVVNAVQVEDPAQRFALLYALQRAGLGIAEGPRKARAFAEAVLARSGLRGGRRAEEIIPWRFVKAQAHLLVALSELWSKDLIAAGKHASTAYSTFMKLGDETSAAQAELSEAQRRFFLGRFRESLSLARRARLAFAARRMDDLEARAAVAEGLALAGSGDYESALAAYRSALPVFERLGLWSNYVGAVNSVATALFGMGHLDESRRALAVALKRFSKKEHRAWQGYLQHGLGDLLLATGRYAQAAREFRRAVANFGECGLNASAQLSRLAEAEAWARQGEMGNAALALETVRQFAMDASLDPFLREEVLQGVARALQNRDEIPLLREQLASILR